MKDHHIYVFNHFPRTAGGALIEALSQWFCPVFDYQKSPDNDARNRWLSDRIDLKRLRPGQILIGHYTGSGAALHQRYPEVFDADRYRLITFLRNPWEMAISNYRYLAALREVDAANPDRVVLALVNCYSKGLGSPPLQPNEALNAYWFVGETGCMQLCCDRLAEALTMKPYRLNRVNESPSVLKAIISPNTEPLFREQSNIDFQLYRLARLRAQMAIGASRNEL